MLTNEQARHVADNPDGCDVDEIVALAAFIGSGDHPSAQAASIWPNSEGFDKHGNRIEAAKTLRLYCKYKARAMERRVRGHVNEALEDEFRCDQLYRELPMWARW